MIEQLKTSNLADMFQRFVKDFVRVLEENPRLDGISIKGIVLAAGVAQEINHKLDRQPVGWEITDLTYTGVAPLTVRRNAWDSKTINLQSIGIGVSPTIDIWIY